MIKVDEKERSNGNVSIEVLFSLLMDRWVPRQVKSCKAIPEVLCQNRGCLPFWTGKFCCYNKPDRSIKHNIDIGELIPRIYTYPLQHQWTVAVV